MNIGDAVLGSFGDGIEILLDTPKMMMIGNSQLFVENYLALAEYKSDSVKLVTRLGILEIFGSDFEILVMKEKNIAVSGKIDGIRLI